jgi:hypothetical protein
MPLDGTFHLNQLHDGMSVDELQDLWEDLLRLEKLVEPDTFGETLAAVAPNVTEAKVRRCPLRYAGLEDLWFANEYARSIGALPDIEALNFHARGKQTSREHPAPQRPASERISRRRRPPPAVDMG